jgi:hypothetical protein
LVVYTDVERYFTNDGAVDRYPHQNAFNALLNIAQIAEIGSFQDLVYHGGAHAYAGSHG